MSHKDGQRQSELTIAELIRSFNLVEVQIFYYKYKSYMEKFT